MGSSGVCGCLALSLVLAGVLGGCDKPHRIGEHVWVRWDSGRYRAFVVARMGEARYRVQFEGCDGTWQRDVPVENVEGRVEDSEAVRSPERVACAPNGPAARSSAQGRNSSYKVGDRVRVRWRDSVYQASIAQVVSPDRFLVHYDGYESAWDEVVSLDRIEGVR